MNRNIGIATAYGYALSKGYTGTEEEFAELMARLPEFAAEAEASAQAAETAQGKAEDAQEAAEAAASSWRIPASAADIGKVLVARAVSGGRVTEWDFEDCAQLLPIYGGETE